MEKRRSVKMGKLKTSVRLFGGVPAIHVNGVPVTGLMHWNRNMQAEDVRLFAESGIRFFSFIGNLDLGDGTPTEDGIRAGFQTMTAECHDGRHSERMPGGPCHSPFPSSGVGRMEKPSSGIAHALLQSGETCL